MTGVVLVAEDEASIAEVERLYLVREGFEVHVVADGGDILERVRRLRPVLLVLDLGLPGLDGLAVLEALRAAGEWLPVIVVSARDEESDRLRALDGGADDYLTKPFSPRELVSRVHAVLRRSRGRPDDPVLHVGAVELDPRAHTVRAAGQPVELSTTEFALLHHLLRDAGRVVSRGELLSQVWGYTAPGGTRTVDVHVAQVRAKLGAAAGQLRTVRGVGYRVDAQ